ncbi:nucleotide sugar dehydrogenase [Altererythrobacter sp. Z27]|uniref:nucleotide sugar dehydrogenase n=1 Tax=Altererythrobacter sp. Z27 TaxID=3461147 RepID=UPI0040441D58
MKVAVFGLGHVGSVAAGCLASQGHRVVGFDTDPAKVEAINSGRSPIVEPGLDALIARAVTAGQLYAQADVSTQLDDCDIAMVCVGTPSAEDGAHDLHQIVEVSRSIAGAITPNRGHKLTIAYRSTVRPGTCEDVILPIYRECLGEAANDLVELVHHPEFLREAQAVDDFLDPPRIVIGTLDGAPSQTCAALYEGYSAPIFHVGIREAEMTKFMDNAWHATKVTFANEIGRLCETLGVSARQMHAMFIADTRLNTGPSYLRPGAPFGGSCLPKDVRALRQVGRETGADVRLVDALLDSNEAHKRHQLERATAGLEPGAHVLLVGLAFKRGTDDLRESPQVDLARSLVERGFRVDIFDPYVEPGRLLGQNLRYVEAHLPGFAGMMVDKPVAEARPYARVLAGNKLVEQLDIDRSKVVALCTIP